MKRTRFAQHERLKRKKWIDQLFKEGKAIHLPPLRIVYLPCDSLLNHQVLFAVPKKRVKSAVARNKLKRRMREAYRLHKHQLAALPAPYFLLGYVYIGSDASCSFKRIQQKLITSLQRLNSFAKPPQP